MSRKVILNLAISLDGCISDENGGFDWIVGHGDERQNTVKQFSFSDFSKECDTIVMGRKSYEDCDIKTIEHYEEKRFIVATSHPKPNRDNVEFVNGNIVKMVADMKKEKGESIWLFGGAQLADSFLKADIIDEYIIGIIPVILGKGRKLFFRDYPFIKLHLTECTVSDGIPILRYTKRIG